MSTITPERMAKLAERRRKRIEKLREAMRKDVVQLKGIIYGKPAAKTK